MGSLQQDIKTQSAWLIQAFRHDGFRLDYSVASLQEVDRFFELHTVRGEAKPGGRFAQNLGSIIFAAGAYLGETIILNAPGAQWVTNDEDPDGEVNAEICLADESIIWPMQRAMKRFKNGAEDDFFTYGVLLTQGGGKVIAPLAPAVTPAPPVPSPSSPAQVPQRVKPWWKFW